MDLSGDSSDASSCDFFGVVFLGVPFAFEGVFGEAASWLDLRGESLMVSSMMISFVASFLGDAIAFVGVLGVSDFCSTT